jgi:signal transduction histidine kinase
MADEGYLGGRILIVDDEETNVLLLERMLSRAGYGFLTSTTDSREAVGLFRASQADLVILDLMMPHLDGFAVMEQILAETSGASYIPILVLTADVTPGALRHALSSGAKDFLTKPFDQTELLLRVKNLLETRFLYLSLQHQVTGLEQLSILAQEAVRTRDESLSEISHDLGQPLAALRLNAGLLKQDLEAGSTLERGQLIEDLARIDSAADQLSEMISELSDLARLQMGRDLVLQRRQADLVRLARAVSDQYKGRSKRLHIRVESSSSELVGEWDNVRLQRALSNLLDNAIKYSPRGGEIVLSLDMVQKDGAAQARVTVADQGIGIPEVDLPHVFDRYYRAGNVAGNINGTGVGLAGVKQIIEQHGGSIAIASEEGHGTQVTILLPIGDS